MFKKLVDHWHVAPATAKIALIVAIAVVGVVIWFVVDQFMIASAAGELGFHGF